MWQYFNGNWKQKERAKQQRQTEKWMKCKQSKEPLSQLSYLVLSHCMCMHCIVLVRDPCKIAVLLRIKVKCETNEAILSTLCIRLRFWISNNTEYSLKVDFLLFFLPIVDSIKRIKWSVFFLFSAWTSSTNIVNMNSYISICWQRSLYFMRPFIHVQCSIFFCRIFSCATVHPYTTSNERNQV